MNNEAKQGVLAGLVRNLTTRWELNRSDLDDVNTNTGTPTKTTRSRGVKPRKTIPHLHNNFFRETLCPKHGALSVAWFTEKQEREGGPNQTSNIMTVQVLTTYHPQVNVILKSLNSSPDANVPT
jgi:hypothetical protein